MSAKRVSIVSLKMVKERSLLYSNRTIRSPHDGASLFREYLGEADREHFILMGLNTKNEPTLLHTVSIGTLNASLVCPREVMKAIILSNSASFMVCHNHPSGNPSPSPEDIEVTKRLQEVGNLLGTELLDHIVLGENGNYLSMKEKGYL